MSLIDDYKNGKRYGTDWQAPSFQHMNDLVGTVSDANDKADNALSKSTTAENNSTNALTKATTAETNSTNAVNTANTANSNSQAAVTTANNANTKSDQAISTANDADTKATNAETTVNNLTQPPDVSEANKFGVVNVEIIGTETNDEKFKFSNLKGNGIATIAKTGSNGLQDIYTITFDNGGTFSFNVTNGKGITNISKTNTSGLVDTYTITYNDESTSIFTITNGDSIELRVADGYFQWKYTTSSTWNNLISLGELSNVDQELSETSTNAIANSAVTQALNNKSTITVNDIVQTTLNFDSDPQTQIDNIRNNNTKISNGHGGFAGGYGATVTFGGAVGQNAHSNGGGAVGDSAKSGNGFAGGYKAKTINSNDFEIDAIQLGTGTNTQTKTLQVYDDNIYDANTHNLSLLGSFSALNNIGGGFSISDPVNVGIELGRKDGTPGTPYFDFHTDGNPNTDYNVRILATGNELQITATDGVTINNQDIISVVNSGNGFINMSNGYEYRYGYDEGAKSTINHVTFSQPFSIGKAIYVFKQNIGTSSAKAGQQRAFTVQNVSTTGFSYYRPDDNNITSIYYFAMAVPIN